LTALTREFGDYGKPPTGSKIDYNEDLIKDQNKESSMKPVQVSEDIVPLSEFKTQASKVMRKLKSSQRPIIITQNGKPAAVLITPDEFDRHRERDRFVSAVREGIADAEAGRVVSDAELLKELEAEFGPLKGR
jgi:prevent-host-death family protein